VKEKLATCQRIWLGMGRKNIAKFFPHKWEVFPPKGGHEASIFIVGIVLGLMALLNRWGKHPYLKRKFGPNLIP